MSTIEQEKAFLEKAFRTAHALEALGNYQDADEPLVKQSEEAVNNKERNSDLYLVYGDHGFWWEFFDKIEQNLGILESGTEVHFRDVVLSEWSPRIPGLFWRKDSQILRAAAQQEIEIQTPNWTKFSPRGKSQMVTGGVGTLRLPPSEQGYRLGCISASDNASTGAPVLIAPEVWDKHQLAEGCVVDGRASLRAMPTEWSRNFPTIKGLPKVCLVLSNQDHIENVKSRDVPVRIHPFSIMEYWDGDAQLLDFVYCTADSSNNNRFGDLESYFENYRQEKEREGQYLIAADIENPIWDAEFSSPAEMRTVKADQLKLIETRAIEAAEGRDDTEALIRLLSQVSDVGDLKRLSEAVDISWRRWFKNGSIVDEAVRLVGQAMEGDKHFQLMQAAQLEITA